MISGRPPYGVRSSSFLQVLEIRLAKAADHGRSDAMKADRSVHHAKGRTSCVYTMSRDQPSEHLNLQDNYMFMVVHKHVMDGKSKLNTFDIQER